MKIDRLEAHDRFIQFTKHDFDIGNTCQDIINSRPFGTHNFYIFAHKREIGLDERVSLYNQALFSGQFTEFDKIPNARIIWQPRLTKPKAQPNSMLFKAYPGSDNIKVIWMLPAEELWDQYTKEKMTQNQVVSESIYDFKNNRKKLESKEDDDLSDDQIDAIYKELSMNANEPKFFSI
jgi:hypothetical protein